MLHKMKTLTGLTLPEAFKMLDKPLPAGGYKAIPGGLNLTDICPNWTKKILSLVFGPTGIGWGFAFRKEDLEMFTETTSKGREVPGAKVYGQFWYKYIDSDGDMATASFPVTGANTSQNGNIGYAMKGTVTNAIGNGASMLGFQESVYLGKRSHNDPNGQAVEVSLPVVVAPPPPVPTVNPPVAPVAEPVENTSPSVAIDAPSSPSIATTVPLAPTTVVDPEKPSLAEKVGFRFSYYTCIACGHGERITKDPDNLLQACKNCGSMANESLVWSPNEGHWQKVMEKTNDRIKKEADAKAAVTVTDLPDGKRELQKLLKDLADQDRGLVLQALSDAAGKKIERYTDATVEQHQKAVAMLQGREPRPEPTPVETAPAETTYTCAGGCGVALTGLRDCPICGAKPVAGEAKYPCPIDEVLPDRGSVTRKIYQLGGKLGFNDLSTILAHVAEVVGEPVKKISDLHDGLVLKVYQTMAYEARGK